MGEALLDTGNTYKVKIFERKNIEKKRRKRKEKEKKKRIKRKAKVIVRVNVFMIFLLKFFNSLDHRK